MIDGVGLAVTRIDHDDGTQRIQYDVSQSNAIVMPSRYSDPAPFGVGFQATPLVWKRLLDAAADGSMASVISREGDTIVVRAGAYAVYIDDATAEIRRADISGSGMLTTLEYTDWTAIPTGEAASLRHPSRITMSMAANDVERTRREYRVEHIATFDSQTPAITPSFTAGTLVRDQLTNTNRMGDGTLVELGASVEHAARRTPPLSMVIAGCGATMLALAGIVVAKRRMG